MTVSPIHRPPDSVCSAWVAEQACIEDRILDVRADLLTHLAAGLGELAAAFAALEELRAPGVWDVALAEGRDGRDVAARIDGTIRDSRAAYAVLQMLFGGEGPR